MKFSKQIAQDFNISPFLNLFIESLDIKQFSSVYILVLINSFNFSFILSS